MEYVPFNRVGIAQRPWDPVSGVDASTMDLAATAAQMQAMEMARTRHAQQQAELERYRGQTPNELYKSNLEGLVARESMNIPGYGRTIGLGNMGDAMSKHAKGSFDQRTLEGRVNEANVGSEIKTAEDLSRWLDMYEPALQAAGSPLEAQSIYGEMLKKVPQSHRGMFPTAYDGSVHDTFGRLREAVKNSPAHRRAIEVEDKKLDTARENNRYTNDTNYAIALLRLEQIMQTAEMRLALASNKLNFQQYITQYFNQQVAQGKLTPEQAARGIEEIMYNSRVSGVGSVDPNAIKGNILPELNPGPRPAPNPVIQDPSAKPKWDDNKEKRLQELLRKRNAQ